MKSKLMKLAWVRCNDAPTGEGRLQCPCENVPLTKFDPSQGDVICNCGRRYSWDGSVKGRSVGSEALTAYRVIFEDGTSYATSMALEVDLQMALNYFVDRPIEGKMVVDVDPCWPGAGNAEAQS